MSATARIIVIADLQGRVVGAQLSNNSKTKVSGEPMVSIAPMKGQQAIEVDVPTEVLKLPGPCLHRFFSEIQIRWPVDVQLPKVEIVKQHGGAKR
jgi:hypothetical protein